MRDLTTEEQANVSGGGGISTGDVATGNATANGNSVDAGDNSVSAHDNVSNNELTLNVDTNNTTVDRISQSAETRVWKVVDGVLT